MIPTFNTFDITHVLSQAFFPMMGKFKCIMMIIMMKAITVCDDDDDDVEDDDV